VGYDPIQVTVVVQVCQGNPPGITRPVPADLLSHIQESGPRRRPSVQVDPISLGAKDAPPAQVAPAVGVGVEFRTGPHHLLVHVPVGRTVRKAPIQRVVHHPVDLRQVQIPVPVQIPGRRAPPESPFVQHAQPARLVAEFGDKRPAAGAESPEETPLCLEGRVDVGDVNLRDAVAGEIGNGDIHALVPDYARDLRQA